MISKGDTMGMFFSNIHIKKNNNFTIDELISFLTADMTLKGYKLLESDENAEMSIAIYSSDNSQWISVASDVYNFNDDKDTRVAAEPISEKFNTDVIAVSCMDSDYAFMHLINSAQQVDGWINSGAPYDGTKVPRRTSVSQWKNVVSDIEKFKAVVKEKNTFAEEVLFSSAELLGMDTIQCALEPDRTELINKNRLVKLYFSLPQGTEKVLPDFQIIHYSLSPCMEDQNQVVFVNNKGGRSKGIGIMFVGDYIEYNDVIIYNATFESDYGSEMCKRVPITFEKKKNKDGNIVLWWEDKSFQIPPAVNPKLPMMKRMNLEFKKEFGIRFFVKGNEEKFRDVKVYLIPLENVKNGWDSWCVKEGPKNSSHSSNLELNIDLFE